MADVIDISNLPHAAKAQVMKIVSNEVLAKEYQAIKKEDEEANSLTGEVPDIAKETQKVVEKTGISNEEASKLVVSMLFWKSFGSVIVHSIVGSVFLILAGLLILKRYLVFTEVHITYDPERRDIFGRSVILTKITNPLEESDAVELYVLISISILIWICIVFSY
jgi:hypothetical protein